MDTCHTRCVQREFGLERTLPCGLMERKTLVLLPIVDTLRRRLRHMQLLVLEAIYKRHESVLDNNVGLDNIDVRARRHR
jgi:hypothetical protein